MANFKLVQRELFLYYLDIAKILAQWSKRNGKSTRTTAEALLHELTAAGMSNAEKTMDLLLGPECEMDARESARNNPRVPKAAKEVKE